MRRRSVLVLTGLLIAFGLFIAHGQTIWKADIRYAEQYCRAEALLIVGTDAPSSKDVSCRLENSDGMLRMEVVGTPGLYMNCLDPGLLTFELRECTFSQE